ncbi:DUF7033 domain-containing protein [Dokdonia sinensis]|nr:hypothetical protein [Dokdonia sinensis]
MLLVYTHKITPRISYTFKHIFTRMLGLPVSFTSKVEEVVAHEGPKISYTQKQLGNELHFKSTDLLFEQGITDASIKVSDWNGVPCFFQVGEMSAMPYDIFAATFYLLSRYEEYLPHVKDELGRYPASESLALQNHFLHRPVVDIWVQRLEYLFKRHFKDFVIPERLFREKVLVKVPQAYAFRKLGLLRTLGGFFSDFFNFRLRRNFDRLQVLLGARKDPYDSFTWFINIQKQTTTKIQFFFELGDFSEESRNVKHSKSTFQSLIKMVADYSKVGLMISKGAVQSLPMLKVERRRLEDIVNRSLDQVAITHNLIHLPETYRNCIDQEIVEDYSMHYATHSGFRAGTCSPFLFYDLDYEIQTPLILYPTCSEDRLLVDERRGTIDMVTIRSLYQEAKAVNGYFIIGFTNTSVIYPKGKELLKTIVLRDA